MTDVIDAGRPAPWADAMRRALRGGAGSDVPCAGCTACCTSFQFVHVDPEEADAIAHIPRELLFPAPSRPPGHLVMGYDRDGRCPMLGERGCTIYEHRPRTCRMYDCRVFAATGVEPEGDEKAAIRERVRGWRFEVRDQTDATVARALRSAATYLRDHPDVLPDGAAGAGPTALAVLAVDALPAFVARTPSGGTELVAPAPDAVRAVLAG